uniref:DUF3841 domain-containing protein n=1 Tax=Panagrellus redivivus TaxID=6233 RepID=A0A7E4VML2_PANRE
MDCVEVYPEEYDDVVKFMLCFSRSFVNKFAVRDNSFPPELMAKLNEAFKQHETHSMITSHFSNISLTLFYNNVFSYRLCTVYFGLCFLVY